MKTNTTLTYSQYNEQQVRESGLLTSERMAEVSAQIDAKIGPCFDAAGQKLSNAFIADCPEGRLLFARCDDANAVEYMRRSVLAGVLTTTELEMVNRGCSAARESRLDAERFGKATKVETWEDGVFFGDTYFASLEELYDHLQSEECEWPEYVWAAKPRQVISGLRVSDVVENDISSNGWEDMGTDDLNGIEDLQVALDKFMEANAGVTSFWPDYSTAVLVPRESSIRAGKIVTRD